MADATPTEAISTSAPEQPALRLPPWRWIWRLLWLIVLVSALAWFAAIVLNRVRDLLTILLFALFASFALEPAASYLAQRGWRRGVATFAIMAAAGLLGVLLLALMIPVFVDQLVALVRSAPDLLDELSGFTDRVFRISISQSSIEEALAKADLRLAGIAQNVAGNILGVGAAVLGTIFNLLMLALFTFYLVAEGPKLRRLVCSVLPPAQQETVLWTWEVAIDKTGAYLYSRLILAFLSGTATYLILSILGVQSALPLAVWMGLVSQFIPVIGTYIAMSLPLLVAAVGQPFDALVLVIFFTAYQQVENVFLGPKISSRTLQLHPAVAFAAAIAGGSVGGIMGAFLSLPAAAIVQALGSAYVHRHEVLDTELTRHDEEADELPGEAQTVERTSRGVRRLLERLRKLGS
jgi:predicted PurR-regulated permease PerM